MHRRLTHSLSPIMPLPHPCISGLWLLFLLGAHLACGQMWELPNRAQLRTDEQDLQKLARRLETRQEKRQERTQNWLNTHPEALQQDPGRLAFVTPHGLPVYVQPTNADAAISNGVDSLLPGGGSRLKLTGQGQQAGLWGFGEILTQHEQLKGRISYGENLSGLSNHSTHVAGTIVGSGQGRPAARGMAPEATLKVFSEADDSQELAQQAANQGLYLSNHSYDYSAGWQGNHWYGDTNSSYRESIFFGAYFYAATWDSIAYQAPQLLIVKAAGNHRTQDAPAQGDTFYFNNGSTPLVYDTTDAERSPEDDGGPDGYDCISGRGNAKNILTVGDVADVPSYQGPADVQVSAKSSFGPTDDGRIKPDLVANGTGVLSCGPDSTNHYFQQSGTSNATGAVTGALLLLRQHYLATQGQPPTAVTLKTLLLHTTREAGDHPGPDYRFGWGLLDAQAAARHISRDTLLPHSMIEDTLAAHSSDTLQFTASGGALRITLGYTDAPGAGNYLHNDTIPKLVHDLDLELQSSTTAHRPYVLDPQNPAQAATTGDNDRDNVEQIYLAQPTAGQSYELIISREDNQPVDQAYSLMLSGQTGVYYSHCQGCSPAQKSNWYSLPQGQGTPLSNWNEVAQLRIPAGDSLYLNQSWQTPAPYPLVFLEKGAQLTLDSLARWHTGARLHNDGQVHLLDGALLRQHGPENFNSGEGRYHVHRNTGPLATHLRYQYWSSPVDSATMGQVFSGANPADFYRYEAAWQPQPAGQIMQTGRGYATTPTQGAQARDFSETRIFEGRVNNGDLRLAAALDSGEWLLAGNPYPGPIANAAFMAANPKLLGSVYYFDHETAPTAGTDTFYNDAADYRVWNPLASLGSLSETTNDFTETAQGMMVQAHGAVDSLYFLNSMRRDTANEQFFKTPENRPALWLGLYRGGQRVEQLAVGFAADATYRIDRRYDAPDLDLGGSAFYARVDTRAFAVRGLPRQALRHPGQQALQLRADSAGSYHLKLDSLRAWPQGTALFLRLPGAKDSLVPLQVGHGPAMALPSGVRRAFLLEWQPRSLQATKPAAQPLPRLFYRAGRAWLHLPSGYPPCTVQCYAADGRLLHQWELAGRSRPRALPHYKPGLYLIKVMGRQGLRWQGRWLQRPR